MYFLKHNVRVTLSNNATIEGVFQGYDGNFIYILANQSIKAFNQTHILSIEVLAELANDDYKARDINPFSAPTATGSQDKNEESLPISTSAGLNQELQHFEENLVENDYSSIVSKFDWKPIRLVDDDELQTIPWITFGLPSEQMFFGRNELLNDLESHFSRYSREKSILLYGLTRTGKTSILKYLQKKLWGKEITLVRAKHKCLPVYINTADLSNSEKAKDFWVAFFNMLVSDIVTMNEKSTDKLEIATLLSYQESSRYGDLRRFLLSCRKINIYPLFFFDEFTYIMQLLDKGTLEPSIFAAFRDYATSKYSSFIFAGTYRLRELLTSEKFGSTAQFANTNIKEVADISIRDCIKLINVWDRLKFDDDSISMIVRLSGRIPYFIQVICSECGRYALENNMERLDKNSLISVIGAMIGIIPIPEDSNIELLSDAIFSGNQIDAKDTSDIKCLITTVAILQTDFSDHENAIANPKSISFTQMVEVWNKHGISNSNRRVSEALDSLKKRQIILPSEDNDIDPKYILSVDLFRIYLAYKFPDLTLEVAKISGDE